MGSRVALSRFGAVLAVALAACTTNLSYTYDGGASGSSGTSGTSGSSGEGGPPSDAAVVMCNGRPAQFCEDFDGTTSFELGWAVIPHQASAFSAQVKTGNSGRGLELTGKLNGPGGFATPLEMPGGVARKFKRTGPDKRLTIGFKMSFKESSSATIVELGDESTASRLRIGIDGDGLYVDSTKVKTRLTTAGTPRTSASRSAR